jgi:hypothetical protein
VAVGKIIKLNRKVINQDHCKPRLDEISMENANISKSLENVGGSSGFIHLKNIHASEIVHAV